MEEMRFEKQQMAQRYDGRMVKIENIIQKIQDNASSSKDATQD